MKNNSNKTKVYTKPDVMAVEFSLTSSTSSGCHHVGTFTDGQSCGYNDNGFIVFVTNCDITSDSEFCYHVPTADNNVFNS
jgi:hypothetical protein